MVQQVNTSELMSAWKLPLMRNEAPLCLFALPVWTLIQVKMEKRTLSKEYQPQN